MHDYTLFCILFVNSFFYLYICSNSFYNGRNMFYKQGFINLLQYTVFMQLSWLLLQN